MKLSKRFFASYLDDGEKIIYIAHRHILVFKFTSAKTVFFGIMIPIFLYFLFPKFILIFGLWLAVGVIGFIYHFIDWYFDVWLLTNLGVVDIERNGLLDVTATRIEYHMIEGLAYNIKGFWQTLFNFGDITVDKIGAKTSVSLKDAANPKRLERMVLKYQEQYVFERSLRDHNALKDMLSDMIAYHVHNEKIKTPKRERL